MFFFFCTTKALHIETHLGCSEEYYMQVVPPMFEKYEFAKQRIEDLCGQRRAFEFAQYEKCVKRTGDLESFYEKRDHMTRSIFNYCLERKSYYVLCEFLCDAGYYDYNKLSTAWLKQEIETNLIKAAELYSILSCFDSENADSKQYDELKEKCEECEKLYEITQMKRYSNKSVADPSEKSTEEKDNQEQKEVDEEKEESTDGGGNFENVSDTVSEAEDQKSIEEDNFDASFDEDGMDGKPLSSKDGETTSPLSKEEQIADIKHFEQQCIENSRIEEEKAKVQNADNAILAAQELIYLELDDPYLVDMKDIAVSNEQGLRQAAVESVEREFQKKRDIIRAECSAQIRFINGEGFVKDAEPLVIVSGHGLPMKHTVSMEALLNSDQNRMQRLRQEELQKIGESDLQRVAKMVPFVGALMDYNYGRISEKECIEHLSVDALTTFAPVGSLAKGISFSKTLLKKKQPIKQLMIDSQEFTTKVKISEKPLDELRHAAINTDFVIANDNTITMSGKVAVGERAGIGRASSSVVDGSYKGVKTKSKNINRSFAEKDSRKASKQRIVDTVEGRNECWNRMKKSGEWEHYNGPYSQPTLRNKKNGNLAHKSIEKWEIEVYDKNERHIGVIKPSDGKFHPELKVPGRKIK